MANNIVWQSVKRKFNQETPSTSCFDPVQLEKMFLKKLQKFKRARQDLDGFVTRMASNSRFLTDAVQNVLKNIHPAAEDPVPNIHDVPEELMIMLLQCVDLVTQRKIRRVCRKWKVLLTFPELIHHVFLTTSSIMDNPGLIFDMSNPNTEEWRAVLRNVRKLTFNGQFSQMRDFDERFSKFLFFVAGQCSTTATLHLRCLIITCPSYWHLRFRGRSQRFGYTPVFSQITFSNCVINYSTVEIAGSTGSLVEVPLIISLDHLVVKEGDDSLLATLEREALLPDRDAHLAWIRECVAKMAADQRWTARLATGGIGFHKFNRMELDEIFHQGGLNRMAHEELVKLFNGPTLAHTAAYILSRADLLLPPPPVKFCFETEDFYRRIGQLH